MNEIKRVAVIGASGNFGTPITAALRKAGFDVTIITRIDSTTAHPPDVTIIRTAYTVGELTKSLAGQDAVVCVVGPAGVAYQTDFIDAAEAAGVRRFIVDDFGWGPDHRGLPEFDAIFAQRQIGWTHAKERSEANPNFTYTGISTGNPIDWAMRKFPMMGFDIANSSAIIYDQGTEKFTGTTLEGIGQAVVGVMSHPKETANRFVKVMSIHTCQNDLVQALETATGTSWAVQRRTTKDLFESGRTKFQKGDRGWVLELVVAQLYDEGKSRSAVAASRAESDSDMLGVVEETPQEIVEKVLRLV